MGRILFFVLLLLVLNAIIVLVSNAQDIKKVNIQDREKNTLYLLAEKDDIMYMVVISKRNNSKDTYVLVSSKRTDTEQEYSDRVSITFFENNKVIIPVLEGKYGKEYLYKFSDVSFITGCHIRNIKEDKGIIFFCFLKIDD